jgi:Spy/CpxP family protein refolding chaperone
MMTATTDSAIASRPKTTVVSLLVVAFLCGAAAGAVGMRSYAFNAARVGFLHHESEEMTLARWKQKLNLTEDQTAQLRMILDDFNRYYDNVLGEGHERIIQVLNPEQRQKFEKMLHERY